MLSSFFFQLAICFFLFFVFVSYSAVCGPPPSWGEGGGRGGREAPPRAARASDLGRAPKRRTRSPRIEKHTLLTRCLPLFGGGGGKRGGPLRPVPPRRAQSEMEWSDTPAFAERRPAGSRAGVERRGAGSPAPQEKRAAEGPARGSTASERGPPICCGAAAAEPQQSARSPRTFGCSPSPSELARAG